MTTSTDIAKPDQRHDVIVKALEQLEDGKSLREVAQSIGMPFSSLRVWLLDEVPEQYREAQRRALLTRIAESDEKLEDASTAVHIARAREQARFSRWDAERRLPNLFATRSELTGAGGGPIAMELTNLERARRFAFLRAQAERSIIDVAPQHENAAALGCNTTGPQPVVVSPSTSDP